MVVYFSIRASCISFITIIRQVQVEVKGGRWISYIYFKRYTCFLKNCLLGKIYSQFRAYKKIK